MRELPVETDTTIVRNASGAVAQHEAPSDSIRPNDQWRLCVVCRDGDAYAAEVLEDH